MDTHLAESELAEGAQPPTAPDRELLHRFVAARDETAFGELVRRHSSLVLGVCRRTLRDEHDAEEAFQATFLVLAAKAARLQVASTVGPWLYGVAYRIASRAAAKRARRREATLTDEFAMLEDALQEVTDCHWQRLLDDEINNLPEKYRGAIVLHYLLGKTNKQVAAELGLTERTIEGRQRRGKELLKRRLMPRGVTLPLALGVMSAATASSSAAAAPLIESTIQAGMSFVHGNCAACSAQAVRLAQSEVLAMSGSMTPVSVALIAFALFSGALSLTAGLGVAQGDAQVPLSAAANVAIDSADAAEKNPMAVDPAAFTAALGVDEEPPSSKPGGIDLFRRSEAEERIVSQLKLRLKEPWDFIEQPLRDVMNIISESHDMRIMFDIPALDDAGVSPDVEMSILINDVPLESALRLLLNEIPELTYVVRDDVLMITTEKAAGALLETHIYDVREILSSLNVDLGNLLDTIPATVVPSAWQVNGTGEGEARMLGDRYLVINQTQAVHKRIAEFLAQMHRHGEREKAETKPSERKSLGLQ